MLVVGGSYQAGLVDPAPIQDETSPLIIFDMDASTFSQVPQAASDKSMQPSNLVFPSVMKVAADTLAVLWYELTYQQVGPSEPLSSTATSPGKIPPLRVERTLRISTYQISKRVWRPLTVVAPLECHLSYRLGHALLWEEATQQLLILGGTDIAKQRAEEAGSGCQLTVDVADFSIPAL